MSLKEGTSTLTTKFMASGSSYTDSKVIMAGVPMDFTCSFRPGTRFGPQKIREVSSGLEEYSIYRDVSLEDINFYDCGDLNLVYGDVDSSLKIIEEAAEEIVVDSKFPVFIGGEHLISVPLIKQVHKKYGNDLIVIHFDAHADLREEYLGNKNSHASAVRRLTDFLPGKNVYQFGIRSGTRDEFRFAKENTNMFRYDVYRPLKNVIAEIVDRPVHLTLDIDVLDPAFANGTGTPEPGGISSKELLDSIGLFDGLNMVGFDIVEVSPPYDISDRTAVMAAKIVREIVLIAGNKL